MAKMTVKALVMIQLLLQQYQMVQQTTTFTSPECTQFLQYWAHPPSFTSSCLWTLWIRTGEFELKLFYFWAVMKRRHTGCLTKPARLKDAVNAGRLPDWVGWLVDVSCISSSIHSVLLHIALAPAPCGWAPKSEQPTMINARLVHVFSFY